MAEVFITAFYEIDKDGSNEITIPELESYMKQNNYDDKFVSKWKRLFDSEGTGVITLERFCDTLGLRVKEVQAQRAAAVKSGKKKLASDVTIITTDMLEDRQIRVIEITRAGLDKHSHMKDVAKYIKMECDKEFGKLWHVVIVKGQYWSYYSHEPTYNFAFKLGVHVFLVWRTPCL